MSSQPLPLLLAMVAVVVFHTVIAFKNNHQHGAAKFGVSDYDVNANEMGSLHAKKDWSTFHFKNDNDYLDFLEEHGWHDDDEYDEDDEDEEESRCPRCRSRRISCKLKKAGCRIVRGATNIVNDALSVFDGLVPSIVFPPTVSITNDGDFKVIFLKISSYSITLTIGVDIGITKFNTNQLEFSFGISGSFKSSSIAGVRLIDKSFNLNTKFSVNLKQNQQTVTGRRRRAMSMNSKDDGGSEGEAEAEAEDDWEGAWVGDKLSDDRIPPKTDAKPLGLLPFTNYMYVDYEGTGKSWRQTVINLGTFYSYATYAAGPVSWFFFLNPTYFTIWDYNGRTNGKVQHCVGTDLSGWFDDVDLPGWLKTALNKILDKELCYIRYYF